MSDTPKTDAFEALVNRPTNWWDFARELERENAALKQRIADDNKAYGCELMDPSGTIWDHAKQVQEENAALRDLAARMAAEMREVDHEFASLRDYDAARKEAQS